MKPWVRQAILSDVSEIAEINVASWAKAYRHLMPTGYLDSLAASEYATNWSERLSHGATSVLVAEIEGELAGYIEFGTLSPATSCYELMAFYVHPRLWSRGVGSALWLSARSACNAAGASDMFLWVLAANTRAIRFYEKAGFTPDVAVSRTIDRGGKELEQLRYSQRFTPTP